MHNDEKNDQTLPFQLYPSICDEVEGEHSVFGYLKTNYVTDNNLT